MNRILYYVAVSLDGFISGPNGDISAFVPDGSALRQYQEDLLGFKTVIMGRKTYEFGYAYGLVPGQPAYPRMKHYIFTNSLALEDLHPLVKTVSPNLETVETIRGDSETDVYLCGGGQFAGWLLENGKIDVLKLKVNPIILGKGVHLFGQSEASANCECRCPGYGKREWRFGVKGIPAVASRFPECVEPGSGRQRGVDAYR